MVIKVKGVLKKVLKWYVIAGMIFLAAAVLVYNVNFSITKVAFANFSDFQYAKFADVVENPFIDVGRIRIKRGKEMPDLQDYDAVYIFGMGLNLDKKQKEEIKNAIDNGIIVYVYLSMNDENDLTNLTGKDLDYVQNYLKYGGSKNYRGLLNYTRRVLDGKNFYTEKINEPVKTPRDFFYYPGYEEFFASAEEYEEFCRSKGFFKKGASKVALFVSNVSLKNSLQDHLIPLVKELEKKNLNVYVASSFLKRFEFLKRIDPDLVIYLPHGKFSFGKGSEIKAWLKKKKVPLITPISVFEPVEKWQKSQQGMSGGMLTQSIVMPEIDGAIQPFVLFAQEKNSDGLYVFKALSKRVKIFSEMVRKWVLLKSKRNADKKIAVYYYKGPGLNSMVAAGMEVAPSLLNLLKSLKKEGYKTGPLPATGRELFDVIQKKGPVPGPYAKGSIKKLISEGNPELVEVSLYKKWVSENLESELARDIIRDYGEAPGPYMSVTKNEKKYIVVTRLKFGNVVLLPQPLPGYGENSFKLIHGAKKAPTHPYVASYLWARNGFKADAVIHFGTHGSLEFTPWKQVGLSQWDWPDALMGGIPHVYVYVINNVGEAVIAKRRSYAVITSHLTPAFSDSRLYGGLRILRKKIDSWLSAEDAGLKNEYSSSIKRLVIKLKLDKDLQIKNFEKVKLNEDSVSRIDNYLHLIENEKITQGLYTLGVPYRSQHILQTARLMALDGVAYSMAELDLIKGRVSRKEIDTGRIFDLRYRKPAFRMLNSVLNGASPENYIKSSDLNRLKKWDLAHKKPTESELLQGMLSFVSGKKKEDAPEKGDFKKDKKLLKELIVKAVADEKKSEFLENLKKPKAFKMVSGILDPVKLKKARNMARLIPSMNETLDLATEKDTMKLIKLMQDEKLRKLAFEFFDDDSILEEVKKERELKNASCVKAMLQKKNMRDLFSAINDNKIGSLVERSNRKMLSSLIDNLSFYLKHRELASLVKLSKSKSAGAVAAILKSDKSMDMVRSSVKKADKKIAAIDEREKRYIEAVRNFSDSLRSVQKYRRDLERSPSLELNAVTTALNGGYISPSSGGDAIVNPRAVPTGRNLYAIDAEITPTEESWKIGVKLAQKLVQNKKRLTGKYPEKVAFTLWGGEFIRSKGVNLAQIFYLLGVEPVRNSMGTVSDVRLIPMSRLKRPRIDVIVQTSGQFRDIAASRIYLIDRAVRLASEADDGKSENFVKKGTLLAEKVMKEKGLSPKEARLFANARVFGGVNGNYGAAIMGLVESGDKWESDKEIAERYLNNMGAVYTKDNWGAFKPGVFEGALQNTDTVVHPRSSNMTGPLSLDHVYEFMGGINATIRNVTGNDPDSYFNDLRNPNNPVMQELKEAIWTESRTTLMNPKYIKEMIKGGASSAGTFAETFRNTYGWNVMKPSAIDKEIWEGLYDVYINDCNNLGLKKFFKAKNPYALQEMTSVMLETIRKGYWKAGDKVVKKLSRLHAELVKDHGAGCSGFVCDNGKLKDLIMKNLSADLKKNYNDKIDMARKAEKRGEKKAMTLEKEDLSLESVKKIVKDNMSALITAGVLVLVFALSLVAGAVKRRFAE